MDPSADAYPGVDIRSPEADSQRTMETTTIPRMTRATSTFELDGGLGAVAAGDPVLLLGEVDGQVLCFAGGERLFRATPGALARCVRPAQEGAPWPDGTEARSAMALVLSLLIVGCAGINAAEAGGGGGIESFGDALWYGINTISTVGVGDVTVETPLGKLIASGLMVLGNPLYAKLGERITQTLLGGGRAGVDDLADEVARILRATS